MKAAFAGAEAPRASPRTVNHLVMFFMPLLDPASLKSLMIHSYLVGCLTSKPHATPDKFL
jgi:hypothetical protein